MSGTLSGMLRWEQLDALWLRVRAAPQGWYLSLAGEPPPEAPLDAAGLNRFLDEIDALLRREHVHSFCGIVYADQPEQPGFIKIYDPHHMGAFCASGSAPTPARWVLSRSRPEPEPVRDPAPAPDARRCGWGRFWRTWGTWGGRGARGGGKP